MFYSSRYDYHRAKHYALILVSALVIWIATCTLSLIISNYLLSKIYSVDNKLREILIRREKLNLQKIKPCTLRNCYFYL